ncbi:MAG: DUF1566 domain-containing protein [Campylobacterota bacterium]|nr:DUF1566 domain-containing protein [Campylobacterota bacterium]
MKSLFITLLMLLNLNATMIRDNTLEIVIDTTTGLMWDDDYINVERKAETWKVSMNFCENLTIGAYSNWRLPNINELVNIADYTTSSPAINGVFLYPELEIGSYWSSTTSSASSNPDYKNAWIIDFNTSQTSQGANKLTSYRYRCVRNF